jgi:hypothetical protein
MSDKLAEFRKSIDQNDGLKSKRKLLVVVCVIFLSLNLTGATIEEANTFLFKIKFSNHVGLGYLFLAGIVFLTIRYYAYTQDYHSRLFDFWSERMLNDYHVLSWHHEHGVVGGFLKSVLEGVNPYPENIENTKYCVGGIFKRYLSYPFSGEFEGMPCVSYKRIELNKFNENWKFKDYLRILAVEFKYQVEAAFRYRESLDLLAPYLLSIAAILSYIFKDKILLLM